MKIIGDIISVLNTEDSVRDIRQGLFHTAVLTRHCGLAATLPRDALRGEQSSVREPGSLLNKSALELAKMAYSESILEAAIGMAAINSLIEIDEEHCQVLNARDLITEKGTDKKVAIVGHFPFIPQLREVVKQLWVIERNPKEGDLTEVDAEHIIPEADVVGITGTAFINHTIEQLLELCLPEAYVVVLGDTTPLSPVLFDYGINAISGTRVIDSELVLRCVSEGATYRQIKGIRQLTMTRGRRQVC
ncbi:Rossmann-like domain-containing protein [Chloroflexota bacterium]